MSKKSTLSSTSEPRHIPGYQGHCPGYNFTNPGNTFSRATHKLLTDGHSASSGRSVFSETLPIKYREMDYDTYYGRRNVCGSEIFNGSLMSGYSGFVPKHKEEFGSTFNETSFRAVNHFANERQEKESHKKSKNNKKLSAKKVNVSDYSRKDALFPVAKNSDTYVSQDMFQSLCSPYKMKNSDPRKYFISGYSGFIPRYKSQCGVNFPHASRLSLAEFGEDDKFFKSLAGKPVDLMKSRLIRNNINRPIYTKDHGLIPNYHGHVPQHRFKCGLTYSKSTAGGLESITKSKDRDESAFEVRTTVC